MDQSISRKKILIVDDEASVGTILGRILKKINLDFAIAASAEEARLIFKAEFFDLILCDIRMPGESGIDLIQFVIAEYPDTAVIIVSGVDDPEIVEKALKIGAYGYIIKPFKVSEVIINVFSALRRQKLEVESRIYQKNLEQTVAERTDQLRQTLDGVIQVLALSVETRDPYTAGHQRRVAGLSQAIGGKMGLSPETREGLRLAGIIHDLGKIAIPAEILSTPRPLSAIEYQLIKTHAQVGYDILKDIQFPWPISRMVLEHHERMNGSGYPNGLSGDQTLLDSRILMVADVVEAIASHRPYRPAFGIDIALAEIKKNKGLLYDSEVANACLRLFREKGFKLE
jgi:response regulator RpfG family c-di-GMP phosphodiesterase